MPRAFSKGFRVQFTGEADMTEVITATYGSLEQARNTVDDLVSIGIDSEKVYLDADTMQVKVMLPDVIKPEIMQILQRHNPDQVTERQAT